MKQQYEHFKFRRSSLALIETMNKIIADYTQQGFTLTVRQLYYQLVTRNIIANDQKNYKSMASIANDARLAGLMDWNAIEDRTREFSGRNHWDSGADLLNACANQYHMDMWEGQDVRPIIIVEKEALQGVFERVCHQYDTSLLCARGYPSVSVLRNYVKYTMIPAIDAGQRFKFLHFGDHDPSGIDMTRDLTERFTLFSEGRHIEFDLERCALNMDQVEEYNPPENPAKTTDARFESYAELYGSSSWELDALEPKVLIELAQEKIIALIDEERWEARNEEIEDVKKRLRVVAEDF